MSSTPHPTIEGVTVKESSEWCFADGQCIDCPDERYRTLKTEAGLCVDAFMGDPPIIEIDGTEYTIDKVETVIAMIRDQAAWLAAQGATT